MVAGSPVTSRCYVVATFRWPERSARKQRRRIRAGSQASSVWKLANWQETPQQIAFAVLSTGGSSWAIAVTFKDRSGVYLSPNSSAPTGFTILTGRSNQFITLGASSVPIAGYQFLLNAPSSLGAKVNFAALQSGTR
jgi:hypothetical protein